VLIAVSAFWSLMRALRKESKVFCCWRTAAPFSASVCAALEIFSEIDLIEVRTVTGTGGGEVLFLFGHHL